jgi:DNA primase catalytic core
MLEKITQACKYLLHNFPGAEPVKEYLNSRLTLESQEKFQFGYYPSWNELSILTDIVGENTLKKAELIYYKNIEDSLSPRTIPFSHFDEYPLIMPYRDAYGKVVGLVARTLMSEPERKLADISKYRNTKNNFKKGNYLFGLYENKKEIINRNQVYIVEGQFDVIKACERGIKNIVAIGNSTMTAYQFSVISRYANNINLLLDNDLAGEKGRKSIVTKFGKFANIQNFYIPEIYKDIDEYLTHCENENPSFFTKS